MSHDLDDVDWSVVDELGQCGTTTSVIYSRTLPHRGVTAYRSPLPPTGP